MNSIIQQYIRDQRKKGIDDYIEGKKEFMRSAPSTKKENRDRILSELKGINKDFHDYIIILMKAIGEYMDIIKTKSLNTYINQKKDIKSNLKRIGYNLIETEKRINLYINILLDTLPVKHKMRYALTKEDINELKSNDTDILETIMFGTDSSGEPCYLPQEALFLLIDEFLSLCRYAMEICMIQQQVHNICYEEDFKPETRKDLLFIQNIINEKITELKEEIIISHRKMDDLSTTQIEQGFRREEDFAEIDHGIKQNGKNTKELKESFEEQKHRKFRVNTQKDLAKWIRSGIAKYCWKNKRAVVEKIRNGLKFPGKPTIISMLNDWNNYRKATKEEKKEMADCEPYPRYVDILFGSEEDVKKWGTRIFAPTYIKTKMAIINEKKKKRAGSGKQKKDDAYNRLRVGGTAGAIIMDVVEEKKAEKGERDQAFYFDDPPPKKRRYKPE